MASWKGATNPYEKRESKTGAELYPMSASVCGVKHTHNSEQ